MDGWVLANVNYNRFPWWKLSPLMNILIRRSKISSQPICNWANSSLPDPDPPHLLCCLGHWNQVFLLVCCRGSNSGAPRRLCPSVITFKNHHQANRMPEGGAMSWATHQHLSSQAYGQWEVSPGLGGRSVAIPVSPIVSWTQGPTQVGSCSGWRRHRVLGNGTMFPTWLPWRLVPPDHLQGGLHTPLGRVGWAGSLNDNLSLRSRCPGGGQVAEHPSHTQEAPGSGLVSDMHLLARHCSSTGRPQRGVHHLLLMITITQVRCKDTS